MPKLFIEESTLTDIGDAIRSKTGKTALIPTLDMPTEIRSISGGGGELEVPAEQLALTGDQSYKFYKNTWNWFINSYGDYMSTNNLSSTRYMFADSTDITEIPFELNFSADNLIADNMFYNCSRLETKPKFNISGTFNQTLNISSLFYGCKSLNNLDDVFDPEALEAGLSNYVGSINTSNYPKWGSLLYGCNSLRTIPNWFYKLRVSNESLAYPYASNCIYHNTFCDCYTLNEITNLPVMAHDAAMTSNMFSKIATRNERIKNFTFESNNGAPYVVKWKTQTIDLSSSIGYGTNAGQAWNSGLTSAKYVGNDEKYQELKNDPDWWTSDIKYSRYNHDSAVATINSLPDASAYLAEVGGTNTIKFKGGSGELTDGGAINTLTEEEIAVATAKGWTVTLA